MIFNFFCPLLVMEQIALLYRGTVECARQLISLLLNQNNMKFSRLLQLWILLPICTCWVYTGYGQGFIKSYPAINGNCTTLLQNGNAGYYMAGVFQNGHVQKTDALGVVQWVHNNTFQNGQGIGLCLADAGACVALGEYKPDSSLSKNLVVKIDANGNTVWQTEITQDFLPNGLKSVANLPDGGFLACGAVRDSTSDLQIWLVKLSSTGSIVWKKAVGLPTFKEQVVRMIPLSDGNFAIGGSVLNTGNNRDFFVAKVDADGTLLWEKVFNKPNYQVAQDLLETSTGDIVIMGDNLQSDPVTIALLSVHPDGSENWFNRIDLSIPSNVSVPLPLAKAFTRDANDNLYFPVHSNFEDNTQSTLRLIKTNSQGNILDYFTLNSADYVQDIVTVDQNFLAMAGGDGLGAFLIKTDLEGQVYSSRILGSIYEDLNQSCSPDAGEPAYSNFMVEARGINNNRFFAKTNALGAYSIAIPPGLYEVIVHPRNNQPLFYSPCDTPTVIIANIGQQSTLPPIGIRALVSCPLMRMEIGSGLVRRCMQTYLTVQYCNEGNLPATNVQVFIALDPNLSYVSSSIPLSSQSGDTLRFDLPNDCGDFQIQCLVNCDAVLGETLCVGGRILPDSSCLPANANWDGSNLEIKAICDGSVKFVVTNTGQGNMTGSSDYVIIEDQIMVSDMLRLDAGEDTVLTINNPAGHAYYMQVKQRPGHPGDGDAAAFMLNCVTPGGPNLALQLPVQDSDPFTVHFCTEVRGSYDPNDKQGYPLGWKETHLIEPNQQLQYKIRFQNTGNDTAFTVKIRDEVTGLLDLGTFRPGPASHAYTWEVVDGRTLVFYFPNIMLPDSNVNEVASHGFVSFSIHPIADLAPGTVLENKAGIYFDFNDPIITNVATHQIGMELISVVKSPIVQSLDYEAFPNPFSANILFRLDAAESGLNRLQVFNTFGQLAAEQAFTGPELLLERGKLNAGIYWFRLQTAQGKTAVGKIIIH